MNLKWIYGIGAGVATTIIGAIGVSMWNDAHDWFKARNQDHQVLEQLLWKDEFLNGKIPEAPVTWPKK